MTAVKFWVFRLLYDAELIRAWECGRQQVREAMSIGADDPAGRAGSPTRPAGRHQVATMSHIALIWVTKIFGNDRGFASTPGATEYLRPWLNLQNNCSVRITIARPHHYPSLVIVNNRDSQAIGWNRIFEFWHSSHLPLLIWQCPTWWSVSGQFVAQILTSLTPKPGNKRDWEVARSRRNTL